VVPDDQSAIKFDSIRAVSGRVVVTKPCGISNPKHYVNLARALAAQRQAELDAEGNGGRAVFANQFNNLANYSTHYSSTGPEIREQMVATHGATVTSFVMSAGTGGTIAGIGNYLVDTIAPRPRIVLADPPGSVFHALVKHGVAYTAEQQEQTIKKHRYDTICEGIGLDRITKNFSSNHCVQDSIKVKDQDVVNMAHYLLREEGLFCGSSTACNFVGVVYECLRETDVREMSNEETRNEETRNGETRNVVTIMCDQGKNHVSRLWNRDFIESKGLVWPEENFDYDEWLKGLARTSD
jgi:cysteine synthase A